jgi:predicted acyl esterase
MAAQKSPHVSGYAIDPVAQIDTIDITYRWFDHVFKGAPRPAILADRINYQVMGANTWRHAASTRAMSNGTLKLYLSSVRTADRYLLSRRKPAAAFLEQTVDFADRTNASANNVYPGGVVMKRLEPHNGFTFMSEPLGEPLAIAGVISGTIRAAIDKKDMDVALAFYELTPEGDYFNLGYYLGRASYSQDPRVRRLLTPGKIESIPIRGASLTSRQLRPESRLLVQLTVNKNRYAQVNHGSGKDVSDESVTDATEPLRVRWQNDSFISVPIRR